MAKKITELAELTDVASDDLLVVVDKSDTSMADSGTDKKVQKVNLLKGLVPENGWIPAGETWTYASADDPTFTFTISGDKTSKYSAGMRIKLTQTSVKYFIITAVSYSSPNTTITVYGGTDYDLVNATITSPYYSTQKAPQGFPLNPDKWSVKVTDASSREKSSPANGTWYNLGSMVLSIPIGDWDIFYTTDCYAVATEGRIDINTTLSTSPSSESSAIFTERMTLAPVSFSGFTFSHRNHLTLTSKTNYYLNMRVVNSNSPTLLARDGATVPATIRATCAYL